MFPACNRTLERRNEINKFRNIRRQNSVYKFELNFQCIVRAAPAALHTRMAVHTAHCTSIISTTSATINILVIEFVLFFHEYLYREAAGTGHTEWLFGCQRQPHSKWPHRTRARKKWTARERERATGVDRKTVDGFSNQPTDRKINYLF